MNHAYDLILRQAQLIDGTVADVGIRDGQFAAIAPCLGKSDQDQDCQGKLLLGGLHDHHLHLLATAAKLQSADLTGQVDPAAIRSILQAKAGSTPPGEWLRATGYDERAAGIPDHVTLDQWVSDRPMRIQDRTGALWLLNSAAIALIGPAPWPEGVELDQKGAATGRIWRGDAWLRTQIAHKTPSIATLSQQLAAWGVTALTDAGAQNGPEEAAILAQSCRDGTLRQRLTIMGREDLPTGKEYHLGPVKLLFDERNFPDPASIASRITAARTLGRAVAAHCVTEAELLFYLAALDLAGGAMPGDRIEHGSMIAQSLLPDIAKAGLIVVANPGFIALRGDRYLSEIEPEDRPNLQRLASLKNAGIAVLAGSDAPYGPINPWVTIRAAMFRQTPAGALLGAEEVLSGLQALGLFSAANPLKIGALADCCAVRMDWQRHAADTLDPNPVELTLIGGRAQDTSAISHGR
ncbi:hypothetical protein IP81_07015 [Novosphingobium sp. AAP83]|uniref:amidohydrolase family protein n=1 Tax=Novosphingobium sp. AAP83 TaxID=1523425 RepID=UPI0006B895B4|nr:amidohydrolase family protein [Novosphingobium sp. AAP83]KPF91822.1 hypothetical protein IP81_07015 [Novosphingobium sp. AAP83]